MMKIAVLLSALIGVVTAAPAIVWKNKNEGTEHISETMTSVSLMESLVEPVAVFALKRNEDGSESLGKLAAAGSLPEIASKSSEAAQILYSLQGIETTYSLLRDASSAIGDASRVLEASLSEITSLVTSAAPPKGKTAQKRAAKVAKASVVVVTVDPSDASQLDSVVSAALEKKTFGSVVVTSIRSIDEMKAARQMALQRELARARERIASMPSRSVSQRRRLEDNADEADDDGGNNNDYDPSIYFIFMTPNILAGLLFTFFFGFVTWTGISCMGMITGQDVYVSKMPIIGREA